MKRVLSWPSRIKPEWKPRKVKRREKALARIAILKRQKKLLLTKEEESKFRDIQVVKKEEKESKDKPFLLNGRKNLLVPFSVMPPPHEWKEGVVPAREGMNKEIFLRTLARGCEDLLDKFPDWDSLFLSSGYMMKKWGIPIKQRKWILYWVEKYRQGIDPVWIPKNKSKAKSNRKAKIARGKKPYP